MHPRCQRRQESFQYPQNTLLLDPYHIELQKSEEKNPGLHVERHESLLATSNVRNSSIVRAQRIYLCRSHREEQHFRISRAGTSDYRSLAGREIGRDAIGHAFRFASSPHGWTTIAIESAMNWRERRPGMKVNINAVSLGYARQPQSRSCEYGSRGCTVEAHKGADTLATCSFIARKFRGFGPFYRTLLPKGSTVPDETVVRRNAIFGRCWSKISGTNCYLCIS